MGSLSVDCAAVYLSLCHGWSVLLRELGYLDYDNTFLVPIAHAGLCGVVKDFWYTVLRTTPRGQPRPWWLISSAHHNLVSQRAAHLVPTCDFGRKYTDIIRKKGCWTMEDWLHWTETWSIYVLMPDSSGHDILHPIVRNMWSHLRAGLLYFCRSDPAEDVAQNVDTAVQHLKDYAKLLQQHFGETSCKFNLHLLICRLANQEAQRGKVALTTEYWVENLIQWAKSGVRYRTTKYPELVLSMDILTDEAIAKRVAQYPAIRQCSFWEHDGSEGGSAMCFSNTDDGSSDGTQLLGSGRKLQGETLKQVQQSVRAYVREWSPAGWQVAAADDDDGMEHDDIAAAEIIEHTYADVRSGEILHSVLYTRPRTRVSYNVLCQFYEGAADSNDVTHYISQVQRFVKVTPAADHPSEPLRLAMTHLFQAEKVSRVSGTLYYCAAYPASDGHGCTPAYTNYAVDLHHNEEGVGMTQDNHVMARSSCVSGAYFMPYSNMSGSRREAANDADEQQQEQT